MVIYCAVSPVNLKPMLMPTFRKPRSKLNSV